MQFLLNIQKYVCLIVSIIFNQLFLCRTLANTLVLVLGSLEEGLVFDS